MSQQNLSRRAALRQQQEMEQKAASRKRILTIGGVIAVIAVLAIIAIVALPTLFNSGPKDVAEEQVTPPNASDNFGLYVQGKKPQDGIPHVTVFEDYQCPACAARYEQYGPVWEQLVADGKITVETVTARFMDGDTGDASHRAAMAAAAADVVGKYGEMHKVIFGNQSRYTEKQLRDEFPAAAGIEGEDLKKYQELYETRALKDFVDGANDRFFNDEINSTPTYVVNDKRLVFANEDGTEIYIEPTAESFMAAVEAAQNDEDAKSHMPLK